MKKQFVGPIIPKVAILFTNTVYVITDGHLDGDGHPAVVPIIMEENGTPAYRCSSSSISPKYVLTAGHCTGGSSEFSGMRIFVEGFPAVC